jgi:hypothetical protein
MDALERGKKIRETQGALMRAFVGWRIWWGPACGSWWALPPNHNARQMLIEAPDPETLVARIRWFLF